MLFQKTKWNCNYMRSWKLTHKVLIKLIVYEPRAGVAVAKPWLKTGAAATGVTTFDV